MTRDAELHSLVAGAWSTDEAAERYERARPSYAADAVVYAVEVLQLDAESTVLDVGAGTGKLSRLLAPVVGAVIAVEPLEAMRRILRTSAPDIEVLEGRAEAVPLGPAAVDAVVAGQAWHWFDGEKALAEASRVLKPKRGIALFWNEYDQESELTRGMAAIRKDYEGVGADAHAWTHVAPAWQAAFSTTGSWQPLQLSHFPHVVEVSPEVLIERVLSSSVMSVQPEPEKERIRWRVRELIHREVSTGADALVAVPYRTDVYWTRKLGG